jgi:zinc transporter ZupT
MSTWLYVGFIALLTALATGVGVLPLAWKFNNTSKLLGYGNALAAGLMLGASAMLVSEGIKLHPVLLSLGFILGICFILISHDIIDKREDLSIGNIRGASLKKIIMIMGIMTMHSFAEGIGIGVSFGNGTSFGNYISTSLLIHNIPEGLAIGLITIPSGVGFFTSILLAIVSSLPQPLVAIPSYLFVQVFQPILPVGLGLAAGAMLWMVLGELLPEAQENVSASNAAIVAACSFVGMMMFQVVIK